MAAPSPYKKDLSNLLYHSVITGGLGIGYSMVAKGILKMKPADLDQLV